MLRSRKELYKMIKKLDFYAEDQDTTFMIAAILSARAALLWAAGLLDNNDILAIRPFFNNPFNKSTKK